MTEFGRRLRERSTDPSGRRWVYVAYDQLTDAVGPLSREDPRSLGIVLLENPAKAARRPYHRQKLAIVLANGRHFALEQAARGVAVRHAVVERDTSTTLIALARELGPLRVQRPAEREHRADIAEAVRGGALELIEHEGHLTSTALFRESQRGPPWRMDAFYRRARRATGLLMEGGKPVGGRFSFDADNRRPWPGAPPAPELPVFAPDAVTLEVGALIETRYAEHPGRLDLERLPATRADSEALWSHAKAHALPLFGPFEDAMSARSRRLFHTSVSALLNLHRLDPSRLVREAAALPIALPSREGFVRQILGWREYMRHVHEATDGFRALPGARVAPASTDGGYARWAQRPWPTGSAPEDGGVIGLSGGARETSATPELGVPPAYWGTRSGLACLDHVIESVWEEGYSHHITRLMVLSNLAMLLDLSPRELTDWFWVAYVDAYDWVVEPNVLAMGTFALGDCVTTKPYVAGSAYIDRMSDFCESCAFDPKTTCPFPRLYWAYLARHAAELATNPRMKLPLVAESRRTAEQRALDARTFDRARSALDSGRILTPEESQAVEPPDPA